MSASRSSRASSAERRADSAVSDGIAFCLERTGQARANWKTLVVTGSAVSEIPVSRLWETWTELERWPQWSPLHQATTWVAGGSFTVGARFDQRLDLGFPVGTTTGHVTLDLVEPARRVSWSGDDNGLRSCHLWQFTALPDGSTEVSNVEVFSGTALGLIRPLVARRWRRRFQAAVDGLIAQTAAR